MNKEQKKRFKEIVSIIPKKAKKWEVDLFLALIKALTGLRLDMTKKDFADAYKKDSKTNNKQALVTLKIVEWIVTGKNRPKVKARVKVKAQILKK